MSTPTSWLAAEDCAWGTAHRMARRRSPRSTSTPKSRDYGEGMRSRYCRAPSVSDQRVSRMLQNSLHWRHLGWASPSPPCASVGRKCWAPAHGVIGAPHCGAPDSRDADYKVDPCALRMRSGKIPSTSASCAHPNKLRDSPECTQGGALTQKIRGIR